MKIIALQGHSNCGKTHVLNLFIIQSITIIIFNIYN